MASLLESDEQERGAAKLSHQVLWFFLHALLALGSWIALMVLGYAINPIGVPQWAILLLSMAVPLIAGFIAMKVRPDEMATVVWLVGLIWFLVAALWILDMPTGPNACFQCDATEKLSRAFFSFPQPSGLIDDNGPFIGTWPAAALAGYSIGAWLGLRGLRSQEGSASLL